MTKVSKGNRLYSSGSKGVICYNCHNSNEIWSKIKVNPPVGTIDVRLIYCNGPLVSFSDETKEGNESRVFVSELISLKGIVQKHPVKPLK